MKSRIARFVVASACVASISGWLGKASADDALAKRFLEEAPRKWREHELLLRGFEVKGEHVTTMIGAKEVKGTSGTQKTRQTDRTILDSEGVQAISEQDREVFGRTRDYAFSLARPRASKALPSILDVSSVSPQYTDPALHVAASRASMIRAFFPHDFLDIVSSSDFKVKEATETSRDGKPAAQITFEYQITHPKPEERLLPKSYIGTVLFAPDAYWAIIEGAMNVDASSKQLGSYEVKHRLENVFKRLPVVVEAVDCTYDTDGNLSGSVVSKYEWKEFTGGDAMFTLSAYGLPEPSLSPPTRRRLWLFSITVTLVVFCIAFFLYRRWQEG